MSFGKRTLDATGFSSSLDAKRAKTMQAAPSRVLHVRGCPYVRESDLVALCSPFGNVLKTFIIPNKNQAFIEMDSVEAATNVLAHYATIPAFIGSKQVYLQFSSRNEVTQTSRLQVETKTGEPPVNTVLLVTVENDLYPVTIENLYQVFSPYGIVRKIITFNKNNQFKALVEMGTVDSAITAKLHLEGKDMFQGCCTLRIGFSTLPELSVKTNGPRSRDFSMPYDPSQGLVPQLSSSSAQQQQQYGMGMAAAPYGVAPASFGMPSNPLAVSDKGPVLLVNNLSEDRVTPDVLFTLFGVYGDVMRVKILYNKKDTALVQFRDATHAVTAHTFLNHVKLYDKEMLIQFSKHKEVQLPMDMSEGANYTKDFSNSPVHRFKKPGSRNEKNIAPPSAVLFVSNLADDSNTEDLRRLFGEQVVAIEFVKNNEKKMAFIRMATVDAAVESLIAHNNVVLHDKHIRVSFSRKDPSTVTGFTESTNLVADHDA